MSRLLAEQMGRVPGVRAVEGAIAILKTSTVKQPELGVNEISHRVDIHKYTMLQSGST